MNNSLYIKLIKEFNLEEYFKIILTKSKSLQTNSYHNIFHTIVVFVNSYKIAVKEKVPISEIRTILLAALFHDFDHSGGEKSDSENVEIAISAYKKYSTESEEINNKVIAIIQATEYPYTIKEEDLSLEQKIIRDADLTQMYTDNFIQQVIFGLLIGELKMNLEKALETQLKFMDSVQPHTKYGNDLYNKYLQKRIEDVLYLKKLIKTTYVKAS